MKQLGGFGWRELPKSCDRGVMRAMRCSLHPTRASAVADNQTPDEAIQKLWDELVLLRDIWNQYNALYRRERGLRSCGTCPKGFQRVRIHDLKHTFCRRLRSIGCPLRLAGSSWDTRIETSRRITQRPRSRNSWTRQNGCPNGLHKPRIGALEGFGPRFKSRKEDRVLKDRR